MKFYSINLAARIVAATEDARVIESPVSLRRLKQREVVQWPWTLDSSQAATVPLEQWQEQDDD
jgi:hypothetical protein